MEAADKINRRRQKYIEKAKQIVALEKAAKIKKKMTEKKSNNNNNNKDTISISPRRISKIFKSKRKRKTGSKWELIDDN